MVTATMDEFCREQAVGVPPGPPRNGEEAVKHEIVRFKPYVFRPRSQWSGTLRPHWVVSLAKGWDYGYAEFPTWEAAMKEALALPARIERQAQALAAQGSQNISGCVRLMAEELAGKL